MRGERLEGKKREIMMTMINKRIVLTISTVLILAIFVAGLSMYAQSKYEKGYDDGRNSGYDEGYNDGRKDGYF